MIKVLYKPLGLLVSVAGGLIATFVFQRAWKLISGDDDAPAATQKNRGWAEVLVAALLQGAIFGFVKALVDRGGAVGFERATGAWPGPDS